MNFKFAYFFAVLDSLFSFLLFKDEIKPFDRVSTFVTVTFFFLFVYYRCFVIMSEYVAALTRDEIEVELIIRGYNFKVSHLATWKKDLNKNIRDEKFNSKLSFHSYTPKNPQADLNVCAKALEELAEQVGKLETNLDSSILKTVTNRLAHYANRLDIMQGAGFKDDRDALLSEAQTLRERVEKLIEQGESAEDEIGLGDLEEPLLNNIGSPLRKSSMLFPPASSTDLVATLTGLIQQRKQEHVAVYKWGLQFDGSGDFQTVFEFIERTRELSISRGATETELFEKAVEFFSGEALTWYRSLGPEVTTWGKLIEEFKIRFLSLDFNREYLEQVRTYKQFPGEAVRTYIESMFSKFGRINPLPSDDEQLWVIRKNMLPQISLAMGTATLKSKLEFIQAAQAAERLVNWTTAKEVSASVVATPVVSKPPEKLSKSSRWGLCWNCKAKGHTFANCPKPRETFCFTCGSPGVTTRTCRGNHAKNASGQSGVAARRF